jgi:hypothetical protein
MLIDRRQVGVTQYIEPEDNSMDGGVCMTALATRPNDLLRVPMTYHALNLHLNRKRLNALRHSGTACFNFKNHSIF